MAEKHIHLGAGRMRCPCCGPPPGDPCRRRMVRAKRRKARNEAISEALAELDQYWEEKEDPLYWDYLAEYYPLDWEGELH